MSRRALGSSSAPAAVSATVRRSRSNSRTRNVRSSWRICLLNAGCEMKRRSPAALVKLSSSATATKYRRSLMWASITEGYKRRSWTRPPARGEAGDMELGVQGLNAKAVLRPDATVTLARLAEELGYTSWWAGEHVVLPSPRTPDSPMAATDPVLDPLVHLAFVAAAT